MNDYIKWIRGKVGKDLIFMAGSGVIIANNEGEILLQKREHKGSEVWSIPGGIMELGESIEEAAIREAKEETGLDIALEHLIGVYSKYEHEHSNGDKTQTIVIAFKALVLGGELHIDGDETLDLKWFSKENRPTMFVQQLEDVVIDYFAGKQGVWR